MRTGPDKACRKSHQDRRRGLEARKRCQTEPQKAATMSRHAGSARESFVPKYSHRSEPGAACLSMNSSVATCVSKSPNATTVIQLPAERGRRIAPECTSASSSPVATPRPNWENRPKIVPFHQSGSAGASVCSAAPIPHSRAMISRSETACVQCHERAAAVGETNRWRSVRMATKIHGTSK